MIVVHLLDSDGTKRSPSRVVVRVDITHIGLGEPSQLLHTACPLRFTSSTGRNNGGIRGKIGITPSSFLHALLCGSFPRESCARAVKRSKPMILGGRRNTRINSLSTLDLSTHGVEGSSWNVSITGPWPQHEVQTPTTKAYSSCNA